VRYACITRVITSALVVIILAVIIERKYMRETLIARMKEEITNNLATYLNAEGVRLLMAANDNSASEIFSAKGPCVLLETLEDTPLQGRQLLSEIRVGLEITGKQWQCNTLVEGIYHALQPYGITLPELTVILMSMHVESVHCITRQRISKRTVIRYIVEQN